MLLLAVASAWLTGTFFGSQTQPPLMLLIVMVAAALAVAAARWRSRTDRLSGLALAAFFLAMVRYELHTAALEAADLSRYAGNMVTLQGVVSEAPDRRGRTQRLIVAVDGLAVPGQEHAVAGKVRVTLAALPERHYGDMVRLTGRLQAPPTFPDFDYREYLGRQGITAVMAYPKVVQLATGQGSRLQAALITMRERLAVSLGQQLPEPQAALAQGIVLGIRTGIPADLNAAFVRTGTAHVLAISGQNLSIAAALAVALGSRLFGRRHPTYYLAVLGAVWGYALLVGLPASVMRAAVMATLMVAAAGLGRPGGGLAPLVAAAALMTILDPQVMWDAGFQLSFLALAGVLFLAPALEAGAWRLPVLRSLAQQSGIGRTAVAFIVAGLAATMGATLTTLPVVWGTFRIVAALALPATVCALPSFLVIMAAGALTAILGTASATMATPLAWLTWGGASYLITVVQSWAALPYAAIATDPPPVTLLWVYEAALFAGVVGMHRRWRRFLWRPTTPQPTIPAADLARGLRSALHSPIVAGAGLAAAILLVGWSSQERGTRLWFLDGGDAVLVRTPAGRTVLVGGSPDGGALLQALGSALPFWQRHIDLLVLPDPSQDHLPGLLAVVDRYTVSQALEGPATSATVQYREWERRLRGRGLSEGRLQPGIQVELGDGMNLSVIAAPQTGGMALAIEGISGGALVLDRKLTQNLARDGLVEIETRQAAVVKLAWSKGDPVLHPALLARLQPEAVILSGDVPPGFQRESDGSSVAAVADRGTIELGWAQGSAWLRTQR